MAEEEHLPPRDTGWTEALAPMEHGAPLEILPVEIMDDDFPLFPSLFNFTAIVFFLGQVLLHILSTFLSLRWQVLFYKRML